MKRALVFRVKQAWQVFKGLKVTLVSLEWPEKQVLLGLKVTRVLVFRAKRAYRGHRVKQESLGFRVKQA